jgi:hypothetical protein
LAGGASSNADIEFHQPPQRSLVGQHIMREFNESTADEQPAMAAWIILMAATEIPMQMERAGEPEDAYAAPGT